MFKIKNVMTTNVIAVKVDTSLSDVIRMLIEHNITGMPVVDDHMRLVGIISEKNVMKMLNSSEYYNSAKVQDFMTTDVVSFDIEDSLVDVCNCLINNHFRRVPILSNGNLVGIISRKNIINSIFDYQGFFRDVPNECPVKA